MNNRLDSLLTLIEQEYKVQLDRSLFNYVVGDITKSDCNRLFQQNNCISVRAKHLALTMIQAFPHSDVYSTRTCPTKPGTYLIRGDRLSNDPIMKKEIVCLFGQYYPGPSKYPTGIDCKSKRLEYLKSALNQYLAEQVKPELDGDTWAVPLMLGCGAAGGHLADYYALWLDFMKRVRLICPKTTLTFYIYPQDPLVHKSINKHKKQKTTL